LLELLTERIVHIDFEKAKADVLPFLSDPQSVALWSKDFFKDLAQQISVC
jgi:hypothetical protein